MIVDTSTVDRSIPERDNPERDNPERDNPERDNPGRDMKLRDEETFDIALTMVNLAEGIPPRTQHFPTSQYVNNPMTEDKTFDRPLKMLRRYTYSIYGKKKTFDKSRYRKLAAGLNTKQLLEIKNWHQAILDISHLVVEFLDKYCEISSIGVTSKDLLHDFCKIYGERYSMVGARGFGRYLERMDVPNVKPAWVKYWLVKIHI